MMIDATSAATAERKLALGYACRDDRPRIEALFALDRELGVVVQKTREPVLGQMRLAWWRDALANLSCTSPFGSPILGALAEQVLSRGVDGETLAVMTEGWEELLGETLDKAALCRFARHRGATLFKAVATVSRVASFQGLPDAGEGWALADLAAGLRDPGEIASARSLAAERLAGSMKARWPRALRPLGALVLLARDDLAGGTAGSPRRVARLLAYRLTGL